MESMYSITVTNKFSLALGDDEDPHEKLREEELKKEARKKEKLSEKENKSKQPDAQKGTGNKTQKNRVIKDAQQQASKVQDSKKDQAIKKYRRKNLQYFHVVVILYKFSSEGRETREFRNSNDNQRGDYGERRGRGGMRGMVRGRGGPRGRGGYDYRGKREFDRQSGSDKTGVKPVDKKDGAGSHNWGTHNDEIEESLNQESQDWANEKPDADANQTTTEVKEGEATADAVEEKPVEELTLDEYKAILNNRVKPQFNVRKAGEGEDLTRWKKMYALQKKKEGAEEEEEEEEEYDAAAEYPQRVGRQKRVLGIEIQFSDSRRGSGGRGRGRGRGERANGRGFGNRGAPRDGDTRGPAPQSEQRSPRGRQNAPKVDDENDFPSLG
ncbi:Plasminogen activator inhibitor 1 RNA-binding protein [Habropoda laboriosa]|uniref:Plasminogen activator inhibitor 1 RNA-binding protein n=1 Tax=Habropoda laboriosa TaxID=597456 RepID=A0A0L7R309_9HYME|nr:Plasminogen activator inhibitor 1 RNA-binding protein [Habropoda laboriosa]